jgi:hypothetical protein
MAVSQCSAYVVRSGRAPVLAANHCAELDPNDYRLGFSW